jgi:hypothetical protein
MSDLIELINGLSLESVKKSALNQIGLSEIVNEPAKETTLANWIMLESCPAFLESENRSLFTELDNQLIQVEITSIHHYSVIFTY